MKQSRWPPKGYYFLFSIFLWVHLIFGAGLVLWRYKLMLFDGWEVYASSLPPDFDRFIEFAQQTCPQQAVVAFVATPQNGGYSTMRYALYPRPILSIVVGAERPRSGNVRIDDTDELWPVVDEYGITCLVADHVPLDIKAETAVSWQKISFTEERYVLIPMR